MEALYSVLEGMAGKLKADNLAYLKEIGDKGTAEIGKAKDKKEAGEKLKENRTNINAAVESMKRNRRAVLAAIGKSADIDDAAKEARKGLREAYVKARDKYLAAVEKAKKEKTPEANKEARDAKKEMKEKAAELGKKDGAKKSAKKATKKAGKKAA